MFIRTVLIAIYLKEIIRYEGCTWIRTGGQDWKDCVPKPINANFQGKRVDAHPRKQPLKCLWLNERMRIQILRSWRTHPLQFWTAPLPASGSVSRCHSCGKRGRPARGMALAKYTWLRFDPHCTWPLLQCWKCPKSVPFLVSNGRISNERKWSRSRTLKPRLIVGCRCRVALQSHLDISPGWCLNQGFSVQLSS